MRGKISILVSGMLAAVPNQGGAAWAVLQYVLGFRGLGHDVWFVEPVAQAAADGEWPPPATRRFFTRVVREFGLHGRAALVAPSTRQSFGMAYDDMASRAQRTDVLLNIAGTWRSMAFVERIPVRVYLDLDPAFTQLWQAVEGIDMGLAGHTHFVTIGHRIGAADCAIPDCGRDWIPTWQPIVLKHWPVATRVRYNALTTIGNWRGYGSIRHGGVFFGQRAHSLRPLVAMPRMVRERFMPALSIHPDEERDLTELRRNGWELVDPAVVASTPARYRRFIRGSWAEFGVAKSGYVAAQCGWFSDRSICYLASGRPVLAQETGFSRYLPTGAGVLAFDSVETAVEQIDRLRVDYAMHARAARAIAQEWFNSETVLRRLLERVGAA